MFSIRTLTFISLCCISSLPTAEQKNMDAAAHNSSSDSDCICLVNLMTDDLVKNCVKQQRKMENTPRLFCLDEDEVLQPINGKY